MRWLVARGLTRWLVAPGIGIVVLLAGAALGWSGPLVTCGADQAPLCVRWPAPLSAIIWLGFLAFVALLGAWQIAHWRAQGR